MGKPLVIDDQGHERVYERVAAVDVAKASGMVCVRLPHPSRPGCRQSRVQEVAAAAGAVSELAGQLMELGIGKVTLESTSDYWRIWFYLLEAAGLDVQLVSASQARQLSGRPKTGTPDAQWLARLTEMGLLRPSFVPPAEVRAPRHYCRARTRAVQDRTRCWQRTGKLPGDGLIKVSAVAPEMTAASVRDMPGALIKGERDPEVPAGLARTRMKAKHAALARAPGGRFEEHHAEIARMLPGQIDSPGRQVARPGILISEQLASVPEAWGADPDGVTGPDAGTGSDAAVLNAAGRLDEIPGVSAGLARPVISETGRDMTRFPAPDHLVSWAGLCPRTPAVRAPHPARQETRQHLPARLPRPGRHRRRRNRHLPRRTPRPDRPPPRQGQSPGRHRPLHPGHHLAPPA